MIDRATLAGSWRHWWNVEAPRVGPAWWHWLWPLPYAMVVALGFTILGFALFASGESAWRNWAGWAEWYGRNLVVALTIVYLIQLLMTASRHWIGDQRLRTWPRPRRRVYFTLVPLLGVALGLPLGIVLAGGSVGFIARLDGNTVAGVLLLALLVSAVFQLVWTSRAGEVAARMQATEARLQLLQAQIEPHFLFNTLANVHSLIDHQPQAARQMLASFIDYLRGSLGQLRDGQATVGSELALAEAYLQLMAHRMADRLRYRIEADDAVRAAALPALLLQPLVENAIHHGLEPTLDGGEVVVRAERIGARLRLSVRDTGAGLDGPRRPGPRGAGIALANLRERLATRHGAQASLSLQPAQPGTLAVLELPWPQA